ncbi:MAG: indolepyruvate oxidoreductase subunit beta [Spirochaetaceae bacterium]|jgi:indolepyruvate ferredoxin oxidoreductase beta subunit|nr:indolepyruvate oxidoreductase subunit beta [Spirochaetaceae bacterium]
MKCDVILAGVGGQGVLSIAAIIARAATASGLNVRQSEVHGMAQRGGAVLAHLRISDSSIYCDLVPKGAADLIISMEHLESLRYLDFLSPDGAIVTASEEVHNIPDYPATEQIDSALKAFPKCTVIDAATRAKEAGLPKAVNMVMIGAASPHLPLSKEALENAIRQSFARKGEEVVAANLRAFAGV